MVNSGGAVGKREEATDEDVVWAELRRSVSSNESVEATEGILLGPLIVRGTCSRYRPLMRSYI